MRIYEVGTEAFRERWRAIQTRQAGGAGDALAAVRSILAEVEAGGDEALARLTRRFDGVDVAPGAFRVDPGELARAEAGLDEGLRAAIERARTNLTAYQRHLLPERIGPFETGGKTVHVLHQPFRRVGVYVPGGRASYPSTVLHTVIPAQVAGVSEIAVFSPPGPDGLPPAAVLGACRFLGIEEVYRVGGAQAVGAMAFGTASIPRVDKIVGPGNLYVTLAKKEVFGRVDIDMLAGPTEVLVLADETADPVLIAADLLAQAEHDPMASAVLVTASRGLADRVAAEVDRQLGQLVRREVAAASIETYGAAVVARDLDQAIALADELAPEHLQIVTAEPRAVLSRLSNAGAYFLGPSSPEVAGDYLAGPSHVLPTGGSARHASGLSVWSFLRQRAAIEYDAEALALEAGSIETMARAEGLDAHARAIAIRSGRSDRGHGQVAFLVAIAAIGLALCIGVALWSSGGPDAPEPVPAGDADLATSARKSDQVLDRFVGGERERRPAPARPEPGRDVAEARDAFVRRWLREPIGLEAAVRAAGEAVATDRVRVREPEAALRALVGSANAGLDRFARPEDRDWRIAILAAARTAEGSSARPLEAAEAARLVEILADPYPFEPAPKRVFLAIVFQLAAIRETLASPPSDSASAAEPFLEALFPDPATASARPAPEPPPPPSTDEYVARCRRREEVLARFVEANAGESLTLVAAADAARVFAEAGEALVHRPIDRFRAIATACGVLYRGSLGRADGDDYQIVASLGAGTVVIWNRVHAHGDSIEAAVEAYRTHIAEKIATGAADLARLDELLAAPSGPRSPKALWLEMLLEHALVHRTLRYQSAHGLTDDLLAAIDLALPGEDDYLRRYLLDDDR